MSQIKALNWHIILQFFDQIFLFVFILWLDNLHNFLFEILKNFNGFSFILLFVKMIIKMPVFHRFVFHVHKFYHDSSLL